MSELCVRDLAVRYGDRLAISGVDLTVPAGTGLAVVGPNGSGKSTLLKAIAGVVPADAGSVDRPDRRPPAFVLQTTEVDRGLPITVRDTVAMGRYPGLGFLRRARRADRDAVEQAMERLAVADLANRALHDLSGGQRQRVLVAQGLAQESGLLLLDEPVTGLDIPSRARILDVIDEEKAAGRVVVMATHQLDDARRCELVLLLDRRPIALGPPAEILVEDHLRKLFGGRVVRIGDALLLDDPHHDHAH